MIQHSGDSERCKREVVEGEPHIRNDGEVSRPAAGIRGRPAPSLPAVDPFNDLPSRALLGPSKRMIKKSGLDEMLLETLKILRSLSDMLSDITTPSQKIQRQ